MFPYQCSLLLQENTTVHKIAKDFSFNQIKVVGIQRWKLRSLKIPRYLCTILTSLGGEFLVLMQGYRILYTFLKKSTSVYSVWLLLFKGGQGCPVHKCPYGSCRASHWAVQQRRPPKEAAHSRWARCAHLFEPNPRLSLYMSTPHCLLSPLISINAWHIH